MVADGVLTINFSDGDWTGKIIGLCVGWFICFVPFITAIIGCVKQSQLPKKIGNDAMMIASQMNQQFGGQGPQGPYEQQPPYDGAQQYGDPNQPYNGPQNPNNGGSY